MRTTYIALAIAILGGIFVSQPVQDALASGGGDRVTVCHAAGRADEPANWVTLEVPANEGGFPQGHFTEGGTQEAGHEQDYLGPCEEPTETPEVPATHTPAPRDTATPEPTATQSPTGTLEPTSTPTLEPTPNQLTETPDIACRDKDGNVIDGCHYGKG